jgi:hypothetical protein
MEKLLLIQSIILSINIPTSILIIGVVLFLIIGVVLGVKKILVVYYDFFDVVLSFVIFLFPIGMLFFIKDSTSKMPLIIVGVIEIGLITWSLYRTCYANKNIFYILYSVILKFILSLFLMLTFFFAIDGILSTSKNKYDKDEKRTRNFLLAIFVSLSALLWGLVKYRVWFKKNEQINEFDNINENDNAETTSKQDKKNKISLIVCLLIGVILSIAWIIQITQKSDTTHNIESTNFAKVTFTDAGYSEESKNISFNGDNLLINDKGLILKSDNSVYIDLECGDYSISKLYLNNYNGFVLTIIELTDLDNGWSIVELYDKEKNKKKWSIDLCGFNLGCPIIKNDKLFLSTIGCIAKLDLETGEYCWKFDDLYSEGKYNSFDTIIVKSNNQVIFESKRSFSDIIDRIVIDDAKGKIIKMD